MHAAFKAFDQMTDADYAVLGLRVGLEVHQQLATRHKLFCRCPVGRYSDQYDAEILRHMRPTLSELGEYDPTALMERKTRKNIYYRIHHTNVCTYEFDDNPPFPMNEEALAIALELARRCGAGAIDELHVARKQYLDGSFPSGFQRGAIVGVGGAIPLGERSLALQHIGIEEDSCRERSDVGHDRIFFTDRLGIPLVEIVTAPELRTPGEALRAGERIRSLGRASGSVRRGLGAARCDVNVSIAGGTRVEIKGVSRLCRLPRLIYNEARRQAALLTLRDALRERGVDQSTFRARTTDVSGAAAQRAGASGPPGAVVLCVALPGFAGLLDHATQEGATLGHELADRVRVIACLTPGPSLAHSDERSAPAPAAAPDWAQLREAARAAPGDALVLVWGAEPDVSLAAHEVIQRACEACAGVPSESRQPLPRGLTGFERLLPGPHRIYPETDLPPFRVRTGA